MSKISVRVYPNACKDEILGFDGRGRLKVSVCVPPVKGAANKHLIKLLAKRLGIAKSQISILSGEKGRDKLVEIKEIAGSPADLLKEKSP